MEREFSLEKTRNFGIIAHIDAGKTTTSERVLFYTGMSHKIGEVHEGETTTDWMEQERERGITITAAAVSCSWIPTYAGTDKNKRFRFNIIDTPGHIDFTVEVKRSLRVLDGAVVVFDGVAGVEPQSETNWRYADEASVPRICFVNKLDRTGASFEHSYKTILDRLSKKAVRAQLPIGLEENHEGVVDLLTMKAYYFEGDMGNKVVEKDIPENMKADAEKYRAELIERIVENDEAMMNAYLEGTVPALEDLKKMLRKAVIANEIFPVRNGQQDILEVRRRRYRRGEAAPCAHSGHRGAEAHRQQPAALPVGWRRLQGADPQQQSPCFGQPSGRPSDGNGQRLTSNGDIASSVVSALDAMVMIQNAKKPRV